MLRLLAFFHSSSEALGLSILRKALSEDQCKVPPLLPRATTKVMIFKWKIPSKKKRQKLFRNLVNWKATISKERGLLPSLQEVWSKQSKEN
jgi:hypothetical protein